VASVAFVCVVALGAALLHWTLVPWLVVPAWFVPSSELVSLQSLVYLLALSLLAFATMRLRAAPESSDAATEPEVNEDEVKVTEVRPRISWLKTRRASQSPDAEPDVQPDLALAALGRHNSEAPVTLERPGQVGREWPNLANADWGDVAAARRPQTIPSFAATVPLDRSSMAPEPGTESIPSVWAPVAAAEPSHVTSFESHAGAAGPDLTEQLMWALARYRDDSRSFFQLLRGNRAPTWTPAPGHGRSEEQRAA
jgi:hypothetical protein